MAEEKWEEIELVKDENGIVPHEALILALHYHWQEAGGEEDIHGLIDRLHTHGALDHYQEYWGGYDPVLNNGVLVNGVEEIIDRLKEWRFTRKEASGYLTDLSQIWSEGLYSDANLIPIAREFYELVTRLSEIRQSAVDKLEDLSRFGSPDNFGRGLKEQVKNPAVAKAC